MTDLTKFNRERARERAEKLLATDLQQVIRRHIDREGYSTVGLARLLGLEPYTVQSFMAKDTWQLGFCVEIIGLLDIPVRATGKRG